MLRIATRTRTCIAQKSVIGERLQGQKRFNASLREATFQKTPPLAFAFDIDGVLLHGDTVLPGAARTLRRLAEGDNRLGIKIPYVFITNGGGVSEAARCEKLPRLLNQKVHLSQFMQAHTILKSVVHEFADKNVLVLGGTPGVIPSVAAEYGFRKVFTSLDVLHWNPRAWPFHKLGEQELNYINSRASPFSSDTRFSAIFVYHDPRNWALDTQIVCDILQNDGYVLPPSSASPTRDRSDAPVKLVFCNPDLQWRTDYPLPRLGQGGFRVAFQAVFKALTGKEYPYVQYGKPSKETYAYAETMITGYLKEVLGKEGVLDNHQHLRTPSMYMIGDNPESDIAGANAKGWSSVLVKTGVYNPTHGPPTHMPTHIAENVEDAVEWAIEREAAKRRDASA